MYSYVSKLKTLVHDAQQFLICTHARFSCSDYITRSASLFMYIHCLLEYIVICTDIFTYYLMLILKFLHVQNVCVLPEYFRSGCLVGFLLWPYLSCERPVNKEVSLKNYFTVWVELFCFTFYSSNMDPY